jgi:alkaline phosphatase
VLAGAALVATAVAGKRAFSSTSSAPQARNVIIMISDGCGYNHIRATNYFRYGRKVAQVYERWPVRTAMSTFPFGGSYSPSLAWSSFDWVREGTTDSAAAATAMSTGFKTKRGAVGVDASGAPLYHVAQFAETLGKSTGVVTSVPLSHATPAGFVAHNAARGEYAAIAQEMIGESRTDVIMGAGHPLFDDDGAPASPSYDYVGGVQTWEALVAGTAGGDADGDGDADPWTLVQTREEFRALRDGPTPDRVCGVAQTRSTLQQRRGGDADAAPFAVPRNAEVPLLATMVRGALNVLDDDPDGFLLVIEGGAVDFASHAGQTGRLIEEQFQFNRAVRAVSRWVATHGGWDETLVIVTADHETGYLTGPGSDPRWKGVVNRGKGNVPDVLWNSGGHTNALVPCFARGAGSEALAAAADRYDRVRGRYLDNTEIAEVVFSVLK